MRFIDLYAEVYNVFYKIIQWIELYIRTKSFNMTFTDTILYFENVIRRFVYTNRFTLTFTYSLVGNEIYRVALLRWNLKSRNHGFRMRFIDL